MTKNLGVYAGTMGRDMGKVQNGPARTKSDPDFPGPIQRFVLDFAVQVQGTEPASDWMGPDRFSQVTGLYKRSELKL